MDALSIATGVVALIGAVSKTIQAVKIVYGGPAELQVLFNEVSDLTAILNDVAAILGQIVSASENIDGLDNIIVSLQKSRAILQSLDQFIHQIPPFLDRLLGVLFWTYTGLATIKQACDSSTCVRNETFAMQISYFFPAWIVDQSASIFHFTHIGDLNSIKSLYSQGLASSLDVSHKKWNTPLHSAVVRGDVTLIDFFIATEADKDALDLAHRSPASLAWDIILSRSKSNTIIEHLVGSFGDSRYIEYYRFSQLHEVVLDIKHSSIKEALSRDPSWINCTDTHQNTPLLLASRRGNNAHVQTLLHCGADSSIKNDVGEDALIESVYFGRFDCMLSLLRANAPITEAADGKNILHHACKLRDDLAYIEPIIERGTDISRRDCLSRSPLALASSMNHYRTIKYLLDHGADIEVRDAYGSTPLMRAVRYGALEAATLLFSYGADITATDVDNLTILHKVALSTDTSMMKLLQSQDLRGLDPDTLDISRRTAYHMLVEQKPCVETLIAFTELLDIIRRGAEAGKKGKSKPAKALNDGKSLPSGAEDEGKSVPPVARDDGETVPPKARDNGKAVPPRAKDYGKSVPIANVTGMKCLFTPDPAAFTEVIDIIAIHGIGAHPDDTWCSKGGVNWLSDESMLRSVVPNARILRYGYESEWYGTSEGVICTDTSTVAGQFLAALPVLQKSPQEVSYRPIILIAHCFGGLVALKALLSARDDNGSDGLPRWGRIFDSTTGIIFLGTPFRGSDMNINEMLNFVTSRHEGVQGEVLRVLQGDDGYLKDLVNRFGMTRKLPNSAKVACFYELKQSNVGAIVRDPKK
ncbi:hypothetical protein VF21_00712 [Pseudogymnoascus sp. 05NY08]|nr:hypothetical protein VF21_00712 [Pseudogymnoascus sp. 05NY08]